MSDPLHFRWQTMESDQPMPKISRRRIFGAQSMISHVTLEEGFELASHAHDNEQFACVLSGRMLFAVGSRDQETYRELEVKAGDVLYLPGGLPHAARALEDSVILDVFSPPSERTGVDDAESSARGS